MKLIGVQVPACLLDDGVERAPDALVVVDLTVEDGTVARLEPAVGGKEQDAGGGIAVPAFVDMHTHLDKGHIWPRRANPDGTFAGALTAVAKDRAEHWSAADVEERMEFALRTAHAHGTCAIRTHIDSQPPQERISWPVFAKVRERWEGRIALQGVSLSPIDKVPSDPSVLFDYVNDYGGIVGAVLFECDAMRANLRALMEHAEARGQDIDFHVDETLDPASNCLCVVAQEAVRIGFSSTITCGHCCSLMTMDEDAALETLDKVAAANIAMVSLPLCNAYLQDRDPGARRTPRIRGGTLVHEARERGIRVAFASDNTRDPFYAYGDLDMAEVWREATRALHLDHPVDRWPRAFNEVPAAIMGLQNRGRLREGSPADLVVFRAREWSELFARPQTDRTVIRGGAVVDAAVPDYRELAL